MARHIPVANLDALVWQDVCQVLREPTLITHEMERAQAGEWLPQALLVEFLVDCIIVGDEQVEIHYVIPTGPPGETTIFRHLRSDYVGAPDVINTALILAGWNMLVLGRGVGILIAPQHPQRQPTKSRFRARPAPAPRSAPAGRSGRAVLRSPMSPKEAAAYLELSEDTVVRWFSQGTIEGYRKTPSARGRIRLYRNSVEEFDRQRKSQVLPRKQ